jgi:thymidylate synthase (FAD)
MSDNQTLRQRLERFHVPALDELLGIPVSVLDQGTVTPIDYMGGDDAIVQAARTSYGKGTKQVNEDRGLIRYLMRHWHSTPFEMANIKLHVRVPMDTWRQWIRHRTASVNEASTRYSLADDAKQQTSPDQWRSQSKDNKQGSGAYLPLETGLILTQAERDLHAAAQQVYDARITAGVAREQARKDLPLSTYTEAYWSVNLHNLLHFLYLRMDSHAQIEIRTYANTIAEIVKQWVPHTWEAFEDYRLNGMHLSRLDVHLLQVYLGATESSRAIRVTQAAEDFGWISWREDGTLKPHRERQEFEWKINRLGRQAPWLAAA